MHVKSRKYVLHVAEDARDEYAPLLPIFTSFFKIRYANFDTVKLARWIKNYVSRR